MKDFELMIKQSLHDASDDIQADQALKERIDFMLTKQKKTISFKKIAVGLVAVACIATVGAVARGQIAGLMSSTYLTKQVYNISELNNDADKISDKISLPDKLNGYNFKSGNIEKINKIDENINIIGEYPELYANYGDLTVTVHKYDEEIDGTEYTLQKGQSEETKDINGVSVYCHTDKYLSVPPEYEPTDEEKQMEENNEMFISYGSDSREEQIFTSAQWEQNGLVYNIFTFSDVNFQTMFEIAEQIISQ